MYFSIWIIVITKHMITTINNNVDNATIIHQNQVHLSPYF